MTAFANARLDLGGGYSWAPARAPGRITFPAVLSTPDGRKVASPRTFKGFDTAARWARAAMGHDLHRLGVFRHVR